MSSDATISDTFELTSAYELGRVRAHVCRRVWAQKRAILDAFKLAFAGAFESGSERARARTITDAFELTSTGAFELGSVRARARTSLDATISGA